ncbi:MAG: S41 family peptidase [Planctomycetota bacterium]
MSGPDEAPRAAGQRRRPPWAVAALVLGTGCASFDSDVFDERLRRATFDAYVNTIEAQFAGLEATGWTPASLRRTFRPAAVEAADPDAFYGVLRAMLAELDDPHASLDVSPRFWDGPVAEPEWIRFVEDGERVWVGVPAESVRSPEEHGAAMVRWLDGLGATRLDELDARGLAEFLRASAAFGPSNRVRRAHTRPLRWFPVVEIDGAPVESRHDGELLMRGALCSAADVVVTGPEGATRLALLRNAGVFDDEGERTVRRRLHPLALAERLDPRNSFHGGRRSRSRVPFEAEIAARLAREASALEWSRPLRSGAPADALYDSEAFALRTAGGVSVGYLRIGAFRPDPAALEDLGDELPESARGMDAVIGEALGELRDFEHWIIDLTGNPGGAWRDAGLLMSYLIPPSEETIPHVVRSVREDRVLLVFPARVVETTRLARADVPYLGEGRRIHVLVDQDTASAGEIVASMLRGRLGARLVGERTAGAEFSTAEFRAPDGSVLRIGLGGGMVPPLESFQGRGLEPDVRVLPDSPIGDGEGRTDPEVWRATFRYRALRAALDRIDAEQSLTGDAPPGAGGP